MVLYVDPASGRHFPYVFFKMRKVSQGDNELGMLSNVFKWTQLAKGRDVIEAEVFPRIKSLFLC